MTAKPVASREKFSFTSSIAADVWTPKPNPKAYEWWYFDAISDDGRDAVVIIFLDNFIFSPRYNRLKPTAEESSKPAVPAIAFFYYRDGKAIYRSINEYRADEFWASSSEPACKIGGSEFSFESAPYGSGYVISLKGKLFRNRELDAQFEWVAIESDFTRDESSNHDDTHNWNLVAPRSDVSGRVTIRNPDQRELDVIHFRGTGYHDHNYDNRWLPDAVDEWQWGRAHFNDATAVYYRYREKGTDETVCKLFTVRDGSLTNRDARFEEQNATRDIFGVKFPQRLTFTTEDNIRLRVKQNQVIDSSFFYLRFLAEMTLTLRDGKPRKAIGITECLSPKALRYRWLDWMVSMRIGQNGNAPLIK